MIDAAVARDAAQRYQRGAIDWDDATMDRALGLATDARAGAASEEREALAAFPGESLVHVATPYARCRAFFDAVRPAEGDLVVDLGCGTGRLVVYGALVCTARFRGIELVEPRAAIARAAALRLGLERVEVSVGNALDALLEDGTVFYLFRPFSAETEAVMLARLHEVARRRPVVIGAYRLQPGLFDEQLFELRSYGDLCLFRARSARRSGR